MEFLSLLTLLSSIFLLLIVAGFIASRFNRHIKKYFNEAVRYYRARSLELSLIVALTSTLGSLYFSEINHFEPCKLCWYQRIFMYPLVVIFAAAIYLKDRAVWKYVLPLSLIGAVIAGYHYYLQVTPNLLAPCSSIGYSISCTDRFTTHYGFITIPWMAFTAFLLISFFMYLSRAKVK